jgi:phosphate uptake regulator
METRKLQRVGGGTYTVSIPKQWATTHGLEAGTAVNLYTHLDGSIVVRSHAKDGGNLATVRIEVDGEGPDRVRRALRAAQAVGFESVTLVSDVPFTAEERRAVNAMVRGLVGTEVVDERDDELTVRNLLDASDVSVRQSVVQLQFVALSIHRRATASLTAANDEAYDQLRERESEADRLFEMVSRHFTRALISLEEVDRLGTTRPELFDYYETARQLRALASQGVGIARATRRLSEPLPDAVADDVSAVADATRTVVEDASGAVLDAGDAESVHRVFDARDEARARVDALDERLTDEWIDCLGDAAVAIAVARTVDSLARTLDHGAAVADVALRARTRTENL